VEVEDVRFIRNMTQKKIDLKIKKDSMREHNNRIRKRQKYTEKTRRGRRNKKTEFVRL
jgi:hypothetical protein